MNLCFKHAYSLQRSIKKIIQGKVTLGKRLVTQNDLGCAVVEDFYFHSVVKLNSKRMCIFGEFHLIPRLNKIPKKISTVGSSRADAVFLQCLLRNPESRPEQQVFFQHPTVQCILPGPTLGRGEKNISLKMKDWQNVITGQCF